MWVGQSLIKRKSVTEKTSGIRRKPPRIAPMNSGVAMNDGVSEAMSERPKGHTPQLPSPVGTTAPTSGPGLTF